jgi:plasmid stabilization system protein ParE
MLPVDFLPAARRDFDESFDWYAERNPLTAVRFANAVDVALSMIAASPQRFAAVDNIHRGCSINRFPFRIVYRVTTDHIVVVAVAHAKREHGYWKKRV